MAYDLKRNPSAQAPSTEAVRVGDDLRQARLALGTGLDELSARLRIHRRYLEALEEGRWRELPGAAYGAGFIRSYAQAVGIDAADAVRRYRDMVGPQGRGRDLVFPEPVPDRGVPSGALILLGLVVALGGYGAWHSWSGSSARTVDEVASLPPALDQVARDAGQPPLPRPQSMPLHPEPTRPEPPRPEASAAAQQAAAPASMPATTEREPAGPAMVLAPPADPPSILVAPSTPPAAPKEPQPAATAGFQLRAVQESWIQVRDPGSNRVLLSRLLRAGEAWAVPQRDGLLLTTGRVEALAVEVDGAPSAAFANQMGVRRDILLDAERLKAAAPGQIPVR
ncbi:helix-turn-helix domain-containing protein [Teichococcus vastitatis]|uniref:helix-turn-helix domain-containing protein n=1 Tax=Teichococcus vastitatis TaxID=2307076 RepID=UPI000E70934B|nr:RodZ domain-containing protein [Pseudoroseomonas vastitatis]